MKILRHFLIILYFIILTALYSFPLILNVRTHSMYGNEGPTDILYYLWNISMNIKNITNGEINSMQGNIFYPDKHPLAYNDRSILNSIMALPLLKFLENRILVFNLLFFLVSVLSGYGGFLLFYNITGSAIASLMASTAVDFFGFYNYPQNLYAISWQWVFFSIYFLHRYFKSPGFKNLIMSGVFYVLTCLSTMYMGVFLTYFIAGLFFFNLYNYRPIWRKDILLRFFAVFILSGITVLYFWYPYIEISRISGFKTSVFYKAGYSYSFLSFLTVKQTTGLLWWKLTGGVFNYLPEWYSFPGLSLTFFTLYYLRTRFRNTIMPPKDTQSLTINIMDKTGLILLCAVFILILLDETGIYPWARLPYNANMLNFALALVFYYFFLKLFLYRQSRNRFIISLNNISTVERFYVYLLFVAFLLSLGPFFGPFYILENILPGISSIRAPHRIFRIGIIAAGVLSAISASDILQKKKKNILGYLLLLVAIAEYFNYPVKLYSPPQGSAIPEVYKWLSQEKGDFAILELPVQKSPEFKKTAAEKQQDTFNQVKYMYFSIYHGKKLLNGYSSVMPGSYVWLLHIMQYFPQGPVIDKLREIGVNYIILHKDLFEQNEWKKIKTWIESSGIEPVREFDGVLVIGL